MGISSTTCRLAFAAASASTQIEDELSNTKARKRNVYMGIPAAAHAAFALSPAPV